MKFPPFRVFTFVAATVLFCYGPVSTLNAQTSPTLSQPAPSPLSEPAISSLPNPSAPAAPKPEPVKSEATITAPDVTANVENFFSLFTPLRTDRVAISPDGKHIAYTVREGETLNVLIVETATPGVIKTRFIAATDETSTPHLTALRGKIPASVRWMRWVTNDRLVLETNTNTAINYKNYPGVISAINADGTGSAILVTARDISENNFDTAALAASLEPATTAGRPVDQSFGSFVDSLSDPVLPTSTNDPFAPNTDPFTRTGFVPTFASGTSPMRAYTTTTPLTPHVFDFVPGEPDSLYIRTNSADRYFLYKLNVTTGKLKLVHEYMPPSGTTPLLNRQGRPLLTIDNTSRARFPFSFVYERHGGPGGRTTLDKIAKSATPTFTLSPTNFFATRAFPLGFDEDPDILYYASNLNRDTYGIYSLNLKTGASGSLKLENPKNDLVTPATTGYAENAPLIYDRHTRQLVGIRIEGPRPVTRWIDPTWQKLQALLEKNLPGRIIEIVDWDANATCFLIRAGNIVDVGAFYVFNLASSQLLEFARRSAHANRDPAALPVPFNFEIANPHAAPDGRIVGTIIIPRRVRTTPLPVVVYCPAEPWLQPTPEYQAEIRAIADMGFAVLQVKTRGTWGGGTRNRLAAIEQGFDTVQTQDIVAALDALQNNFKINLKRVAIMGTRRGGYLALRAAQLQPTRFKCAVALNPTIDFASWMANERWTTGNTGPALTRGYYGTQEQLKKSSLDANLDAAKSPILILSYPGPPGANRFQEYLDARQYAAALNRRNIPAEVYDLSEDYMAGVMKARSAAFSKIETWLNEYIYRYQVDFGEMERLQNK